MLLFSVHTKSAGVTRPVVVVGNQSRYKSRPRTPLRGLSAGVYDLLLNLLKEISYVSTRSEQIANANLSMSEAFSRPIKDKYSDYFNKYKDSPPSPEGKLSFNVFFEGG